MKRISGEVITGALRQVWHKEKSIPFGVFDLVTTLIDAQLNSCEKEHNEVVREIFEATAATVHRLSMGMKEKPIIFSTDMVKAILDGKTMTRRVIKPQPRVYENWLHSGSQAMGITTGRKSSMIMETSEALKFAPEYCPYIDTSVNIKAIPKIDNYGAGDDGKIYRVDKEKPVALKPWLGGYKNNYQMVRLNSHNEYVHQLVCIAFYGEKINDFMEVRHLDGNARNNKPQNLDWGTAKQNALDRYAHGKLSGENHPLSKLTWEDVKDIREKGALTIPQLASKYHVSHTTIEKILGGQNWRADIKTEPPNMERYIKPLGRLWVRETWAVHFMYDNLPPREIIKQGWEQGHSLWYRSYGDIPLTGKCSASHKGRWRTGRFMPRWASRINLEITDIRVERLQEITEGDAMREGVDWYLIENKIEGVGRCQQAFRKLWDSLNAKRGFGWDTNPWLWVLSFRRIDGN